jgi:hypothetical protein
MKTAAEFVFKCLSQRKKSLKSNSFFTYHFYLALEYLDFNFAVPRQRGGSAVRPMQGEQVRPAAWMHQLPRLLQLGERRRAGAPLQTGQAGGVAQQHHRDADCHRRRRL